MLLMRDGGTKNLKDAYGDADVDVEKLENLGNGSPGLHQKTANVEIGNQQTARQIYHFCYSNLAFTASH